jgi:hypothetical protein
LRIGGWGKVYHGIRKVYHSVRKVYHDVRKVYHGVRKVYHGVRKVYHGVRKVYHGVRKIYHGVRKVYIGVREVCHGGRKVFQCVKKVYHGFKNVYLTPKIPHPPILKSPDRPINDGVKTNKQAQQPKNRATPDFQLGGECEIWSLALNKTLYFHSTFTVPSHLRVFGCHTSKYVNLSSPEPFLQLQKKVILL